MALVLYYSIMNEQKKILIVDDEEDLCLLLEIYFTRKKYAVHVAHNLGDALRQINLWQPDILFLDNNLPDGLGWEKAPFLLDQYPGLVIHLISAFHPTKPSHPSQHRLHVIEKPFSQQQLNALGF
jgi:DNA-binding NtrC family response regulator